METKNFKDYKNLSGSSIIKAYRMEENGVTVHFRNGEVYEYTHGSTGSHHIETMKHLAQAGWGLGSYVEQMTKFGYARQLK
ncbi:MAG: hypothetical protein GC178_18690 [Flavobacteriales bacterium]|nr:hypothetical protein [Flavobacteriales bacterium]